MEEERLIINWFPGHMHRTRKLIKANIHRADMVIEMRDARIPGASCNPMLQELIKDKPTLVLLNKSDMADPQATEKWIRSIKHEHRDALAVNSTDPKLRKKIVAACQGLLPDFNKAGRTRIRAMITGIPNVGKSTLLNTISSSAKAKTGNRPAVTVDLQNVRIPGGVDLIDTPGVLWPKIDADTHGVKLSAAGSIKDSVVDLYRVTVRTGEVLMEHYPQMLMERFKLKELPEDGFGLIEAVGRKRGCLMPGGVINLEKAAACLLTEFREGRIGRITLELPDA